MIYETDIFPKFREADESGFVGARGYLNYFQDCSSGMWHQLDKGNDIIPEKYGISWVYTKYRLHVERESDFYDVLHAKCWLENRKMHTVFCQGLEITCDGKLVASGRLESCLMDLSKNRMVKRAAIEFPDDIEEDRIPMVDDFIRFGSITEDLEFAYSHKVSYTDLDKSHHMTNLRYVDLLVNAFDAKFYHENMITDIEIHYTGQTFEGETVSIYKKEYNNGFYISGNKDDGRNVMAGWIKVTKRL